MGLGEPGCGWDGLGVAGWAQDSGFMAPHLHRETPRSLHWCGGSSSFRMNAHRPSAVWTSERAGLKEGAGPGRACQRGTCGEAAGGVAWLEEVVREPDLVQEMRECCCREQGVLGSEV